MTAPNDDDPLFTALTDVWDTATGPGEMWGVQIVLGQQDGDDTRYVYAPILYPDQVRAKILAVAMATVVGPALLKGWIQTSRVDLPDSEHMWIPLACRVVKFAQVPF